MEGKITYSKLGREMEQIYHNLMESISNLRDVFMTGRDNWRTNYSIVPLGILATLEFSPASGARESCLEFTFESRRKINPDSIPGEITRKIKEAGLELISYSMPNREQEVGAK